jgi:predicted enzyme related to lactoylglutathione lyase
MINAAHVLLFSDDPEADRRFLRDVLDWPFVDAGHSWLIFRLPPGEVAIHPTAMDARPAPAEHRMLGASLYLMCNDLAAEIEIFKEKKVQCTPIAHENWGMRTTIKLPSGGELGLYQPKHRTAYDLG